MKIKRLSIAERGWICYILTALLSPLFKSYLCVLYQLAGTVSEGKKGRRYRCEWGGAAWDLSLEVVYESDSGASLDLNPTPPALVSFFLNILLSRRGEQCRCCIFALSAATTFTLHEDEWVEGYADTPDEQTTQREPSNPQPLVSQDSKKSNWIRINVGATLPSLQIQP